MRESDDYERESSRGSVRWLSPARTEARGDERRDDAGEVERDAVGVRVVLEVSSGDSDRLRTVDEEDRRRRSLASGGGDRSR